MPNDGDHLMRVLTRQVRVLSFDQVTRICASFPDKHRSATTLVQRLLGDGLLATASIAAAYPRVEARILLWRRGRPAPPHERTRWRLQKRWDEVLPEILTVYWATEKGERDHGGVAGLLNHAGQLEHDLGVAEVLTLAYERRRRWAYDWIGEDLLKREHPHLAKRLCAIPDAVTLDRDEEVFKAIEFGGQYSVDRLARLHEAFSRRNIRYEIW